jgi:uncharacterized membrane protein
MFWLALGYPLFAHLAVILDDARLEWLALVWLLGISLAGALIARRPWAWMTLGVGALLLYWLVVAGHARYALFVPPALIPAALFILFARSLRRDTTPLISRVATAMRGEPLPLPPPLVVYTRHVTVLWCGVFIVMFASAVVSAIWASPEVWSLMTNVVHYVALGAIFVIEFAYRRFRYRDLEPWGLFEYLRRLVRTNIRM